MRVLVTGNRGIVGSVVEPYLGTLGHEVHGFDLKDGFDLLDPVQVAEAIDGCAAVVHLAAQTPNSGSERASLLQTNLIGTDNLLAAASAAGVSRCVYLSSVNALGIFRGLAVPDYLSIDDSHPARPRADYGLSKRLAEEVCAFYSRATDLEVVCLRSPAVFQSHDYAEVLERWRHQPQREWKPVWEYGAFIDVRDLAAALAAALVCPAPSPAPLLLCADDIASTSESHDICSKLLPNVEWRAGAEYETDPFRALVDSAPARAALDWKPRFSWRESIAGL